MGTVQAVFEFLQWQAAYETQKPYEVFLPASSFANKTVPRSNLVFEPRTVEVHDARGREASFQLDIHGFEFTKNDSPVTNLTDQQLVRGSYIPFMESFLSHHLSDCTGPPARVVCFDFRVRLFEIFDIWSSL